MKRFFLLVIVLCIAFSAYGTGQSEKDNGEITLVFLHYMLDKEVGALPELIAQYEQEHPGITIAVEGIGVDRYTDVYKTRLVANEQLDIFFVMTADLKSFADAGRLASLDATTAASHMLPEVLDSGSIDGTAYALSSAGNGLGMFVNTKILTECGIESIPENWQEFTQACEIIKDHGYLPWIMGNKSRTWSAYHAFENNMFAENLPTGDLEQQVVTNEVSISQIWLPQMKKIQSIIDNGYIEPEKSAAITWNDEGFTKFVNGEGAFMYGIASHIQLLQDAADPDFEFVFVASPLQDAPVPAQAHLLVDRFIGINENSQYKEEAIRFLEFLFERENLGKLALSQGTYTTLKGGISSDNPIGRSFAQTIASGNVFLWPQFRNVSLNDWRDGLSKLILGVVTPEQMADEFEKSYQNKLLLSQ
jgi:raffinose/stachyose/melibiose transport system substrate-binding protein